MNGTERTEKTEIRDNLQQARAMLTFLRVADGDLIGGGELSSEAAYGRVLIEDRILDLLDTIAC